MLGFILYSFIICFLFPNDKSNILELIKLYIGMVVYGASSVVPAFFISSFIKNKYMICSFPFVFMHFYYTTLSKIQDVLIENGKMEIVIKLSFLYPNELKEILFHKDIKMMLFYFIISVCSFIGFTLLMNRRIDYGQ
jgi:ABC-type transport system involved in multi-copper enzyme maturation permease subunit